MLELSLGEIVDLDEFPLNPLQQPDAGSILLEPGLSVWFGESVAPKELEGKLSVHRNRRCLARDKKRPRTREAVKRVSHNRFDVRASPINFFKEKQPSRSWCHILPNPIGVFSQGSVRCGYECGFWGSLVP